MRLGVNSRLYANSHRSRKLTLATFLYHYSVVVYYIPNGQQPLSIMIYMTCGPPHPRNHVAFILCQWWFVLASAKQKVKLLDHLLGGGGVVNS